MAKLLLGSEVTAAMNARLRARVGRLAEKGVAPKLLMIRCGEDPSDLSYERGASKRAAAVGVGVEKAVLPRDVSKDALVDAIRLANADDAIHGVLLFRPLPVHLKPFANEIANALDPKKDVDCMTDLSNAAVFLDRPGLGFAPCTPQACLEILDHYGIGLSGKRAVVIGRSQVVGKPLALMLLRRNATVAVCHTRTVDVPSIARQADILVTSAGAIGSLTAACVRPGQVVVDVSINWDAEKPNASGGKGAITGDAVFEEVEPIVEALTPVPGGVGAVTTGVLIGHVVEAAERVAGCDN